jgi:hypothetical protein
MKLPSDVDVQMAVNAGRAIARQLEFHEAVEDARRRGVPEATIVHLVTMAVAFFDPENTNAGRPS